MVEELAEAAAVQVLRRLARALMRRAGEAPLAGKVGPGEAPEVLPASESAMATALARPMVLVEEAPRFPAGGQEWGEGPHRGSGGDLVDDVGCGRADGVAAAERDCHHYRGIAGDDGPIVGDEVELRAGGGAGVATSYGEGARGVSDGGGGERCWGGAVARGSSGKERDAGSGKRLGADEDVAGDGDAGAYGRRRGTGVLGDCASTSDEGESQQEPW